jgi:hypothetical protein
MKLDATEEALALHHGDGRAKISGSAETNIMGASVTTLSRSIDVRRAHRWLFVALMASVGCGSAQIDRGGGAGTSGASGQGAGGQGAGGQSTGGQGGAGGGPGGGNGTGGAPASTPTIPVPAGGIPADPGTTDLMLTPAPAMLGTVNYVPNRSSVRLYLPGVAGAHDYRVFAVDGSVAVSTMTDSREHVNGATLHCAGLRQRNQCDDGAILPIKYNNEGLDLPVCEVAGIDRRPSIPVSLMQTMDVDGVGPNTTLVVEAIDRLCPFPGLFGSVHKDAKIDASDVGPKMVSVVVNNKPYMIRRWALDTFPMRTEAEIRADYGSMILNGQGPNMPTLDPMSPNFPESPYVRIAQPAPPDDPVVLARAIIKVSPTGTATLPPGFGPSDYFDDFEDDTDQPTLLRSTDYTKTLLGPGFQMNVYTTKKWVLYDTGNSVSNFFVNRGQLNEVFGDNSQGSMTVQAFYPKRPVQLPSAPNQFLHVTYEVQRNETPRRYDNLTLCGSDTPGQTYDGEALRAGPDPMPGFMNEGDTARTSPLGWNCLMLVPRGAGYGVLPGGDIKSHTDTSLKITVVKSHPAPTDAGQYQGQKISAYATAFGPQQEDPYPRRWMRQIDANGKISGVWLDDQTNIWQRARFDVFIRRDRVVIYVEGEQRICQDLTASPLTMAEGALGFWHILYHTSAEFLEIRRGLGGDDPSTAQRHVMYNTPFADQRSYDNVGFRENVALPANFDPARCYKGN